MPERKIIFIDHFIKLYTFSQEVYFLITKFERSSGTTTAEHKFWLFVNLEEVPSGPILISTESDNNDVADAEVTRSLSITLLYNVPIT